MWRPTFDNLGPSFLHPRKAVQSTGQRANLGGLLTISFFSSLKRKTILLWSYLGSNRPMIQLTDNSVLKDPTTNPEVIETHGIFPDYYLPFTLSICPTVLQINAF